jgi:choline dehydrogenase-like flavoprotein
MATYVLAKAGLKVCLIEAGPMYDPAKIPTRFAALASQRRVEVPNFVLVILTDVTGDGALMVNHTHMWVIRNGNGGGQECWADE